MLAEAASGTDQLLPALRALPIGVHAAATIGLVAGAILWLFGRKVIRPVFVLIGMAMGAAFGFFLAPLFTPSVGGIPSPTLGLGVGAVGGGIIAALLFRFAIAISAGAVLAIAGLLISGTYLKIQAPPPDEQEPLPIHEQQLPGIPLDDPEGPERPPPEPERQPDPQPDWQPAPDSPPAALNRPDPPPDPEQEETAEESSVGDVARSAAERTVAFLRSLAEEMSVLWKAIPDHDRLILTGSGVGGAVLGVLLGLAMPRRVAAVITAMFGAAVWIPCSVWLIKWLDAPGGDLLQFSPLVWLVIWGVISAIGIAAQWSGLATRRLPSERPRSERVDRGD